MEDAATAEISRAQLWQWVRYPKGILDDGREITFELVDTIEKEELQHIEDKLGKDLFENGGYKRAAEIFNELIKQDEFIEFLTIPAYEELLDKEMGEYKMMEKRVEQLETEWKEKQSWTGIERPYRTED